MQWLQGLKSRSLAVPLLLQQLRGYHGKGMVTSQTGGLRDAHPRSLQQQLPCRLADPCLGPTSIPQPKAIFMAPNFISLHCLLVRNRCVGVATSQQRRNPWLFHELEKLSQCIRSAAQECLESVGSVLNSSSTSAVNEKEERVLSNKSRH